MVQMKTNYTEKSNPNADLKETDKQNFSMKD